MLDAESVAGHLLKADSMFAFLAAHRSQLFPEEMFADLFPSQRGRPSVPAEVMASVINHWLHHRAAALNLRRLLTMGLTRTDTTWAIA
ncbi:hypothetical protein RE97_06200 [Mycobacterium avium subsp. paratuberculosis]|nr:hypothetical protein RE97_06200 [Mycobacterium avium subsp. paratuberculosis]